MSSIPNLPGIQMNDWCRLVEIGRKCAPRMRREARDLGPGKRPSLATEAGGDLNQTLGGPDQVRHWGHFRQPTAYRANSRLKGAGEDTSPPPRYPLLWAATLGGGWMGPARRRPE